nr:hypothetical protein CTI12_AA538680 [Tanacetum cinerariifolium]
MGVQIPVHDKTTSTPSSTIQKDPHELNDDFRFLFLFVIMMPNTIGTITKVVLLCSSFLFCVFVVDDLVKYWKNWRHGEYARVLNEVGTLDNDLSVCEKV